MGLRRWSWDAAAGPAALGDRPLLAALLTVLPDAVVEAALDATRTRERRRRRLPTHLVVTLVVAMGLWAAEPMRQALASVVDGWREAAGARRTGWRLPCTAAIVRARRRAGARLLRVLFHAVAGPIATRGTPGAFLHGLRWMAPRWRSRTRRRTAARSAAPARSGGPAPTRSCAWWRSSRPAPTRGAT